MPGTRSGPQTCASFAGSVRRWIPIFLPTGVERDAVVAHALAQLDRVVTALPSVGEGVSIVAEPPSEIANGEGDGGIAQ